MNIKIRNEDPGDYRVVEEITRKAFWNLHVPGCNEHLLVHKLRNHKDFIKSLDFVAVKDHEVIANIMYSDSYLEDNHGNKLNTITFGPVSVLPELQRQGIGSKLINYSIESAELMGHNAIVIWGNPSNYCKFGFKSSKTYNISISNKKFPCCLLVKELKSGIPSNPDWVFHESEVFKLDKKELDEFDSTFEKRKKAFRFSQEEFVILSNAYLD